MKPYKDLILIEKEEYTQTKSGIIIPTIADEFNKPHPIGVIKAIGTTCSTDVKIGARVIYVRNCETQVDYLGDKLYFIRESHIIAEI